MLPLSITLKPAIRELEAGVKEASKLRILGHPVRVLLAIECFSIASKPLGSNCLSKLPAFLKLFKEGPFHLVFFAFVRSKPGLLRASLLVGNTGSVLCLVSQHR
jgi:hypothetical protein